MILNAMYIFSVMVCGTYLTWSTVVSIRNKDFFGIALNVVAILFWFMCRFIINWELLIPKIIKLLGENV